MHILAIHMGMLDGLQAQLTPPSFCTIQIGLSEAIVILVAVHMIQALGMHALMEEQVIISGDF